MTTSHRMRFFDYVSHPFERVQAALRTDAAGIFRRATTSENARAKAHGASLHVRVGALDVSAPIDVELGPAEDLQSSPLGYPITQFTIAWQAQAPRWFPQLHGKLLVYPLSSTETQLELEATYEPPLGLIGDAFDAAVGHRVAHPSVYNFLRDIAQRLRAELDTTRGKDTRGTSAQPARVAANE